MSTGSTLQILGYSRSSGSCSPTILWILSIWTPYLFENTAFRIFHKVSGARDITKVWLWIKTLQRSCYIVSNTSPIGIHLYSRGLMGKASMTWHHYHLSLGISEHWDVTSKSHPLLFMVQNRETIETVANRKFNRNISQIIVF